MHNHLSGDPTVSQADIQMTKAIIDITGPLGISVRDHIIRPQERACQHELVYDDDIAALAASEARRLSRSCSRLLPRPAADLPRAQRFTPIPLAEFGPAQSEKMLRQDGGGSKKSG